MITVYTDGACKGNGKTDSDLGGFGVVIYYENGTHRKIWGGDNATTNNKMELTAAIVALEYCPDDTPITLYTDSKYVLDGITKWINGWRKKGWKKSDGKAVLNLELWQKLDSLNQNKTVNWQWVKGHNGDIGNEMADILANTGVHSSGNQLLDKDGRLINESDNANINLKNTNPNNLDTMEQAMTDNLDDINLQLSQNHLDDSDLYTIIDNHLENLDQKTSDTKNLDAKTTKKVSKKPKTTTPKELVFSLKDQNPDYDGDTSRVNPDFVPILPDPINKHAKERQLIMDTETTGFEDKNGDRIVEIGIIELVGRKFTGERLHVYLNPDKQMDDEVMAVHGISNEFVSDKPAFADVAKRVFDFMDGGEIIAHNASFDMRFLDMEFSKAGFDKLSDHVQVTDTLALAKQLYPGQGNSLNALVKRLNVGKKDRTFHGALLDSEILAEVYLAMTGGQVSLDIDVHNDEKTTVVASHQNLSHLANMLTPSVSNYSADKAWRDEQLKK